MQTLLDLKNADPSLLAQGPMGPFFCKLSKALNGEVYKVNLNAGDDFFFDPKSNKNVYQFQDKVEKFENFFKKIILDKGIKKIFIFGEQRIYHQIALRLAKKLGLKIYIFEEGYLRPNYITLEKLGVNYNSELTLLNLNDIPYKDLKYKEIKKYPYANFFHYFYGFIYWFFLNIQRKKYKNYVHHRKIDLSLAWIWSLSFLKFSLNCIAHYPRRARLRSIFKDKKIEKFLFALQVHDDSQIRTHSKYNSIEEAILQVAEAFAASLKKNKNKNKKILIIKGHPIDRGHKDYSNYINEIANILNIKKNIFYLTDMSENTILNETDACITINSTFGLKFLKLGKPVFNLDKAFYSKKEIVFKSSLINFFIKGVEFKPNIQSYLNFNNYIINHTQVNGCFYTPGYKIND